MLTAADLAAMQTTAATALPDTCTIQRPTAGQDATGSPVGGWTTLATGVACRVRPEPRAPQEAPVGAKLTATTYWIVTLPAGQDVTAADRIVAPSGTYDILSPLGGSWEITRRVRAVEVL